MIRRTYEPLKFTRNAFLGSLFWVPLTVAKGTPQRSETHTWEDNGERWAPRTVVRRVLGTRLAVGYGRWKPAPPVTKIHEVDIAYNTYCVVNGDVPREKWEAARRIVAAQGLDPDEEMEMMQMLGAFA